MACVFVGLSLPSKYGTIFRLYLRRSQRAVNQHTYMWNQNKKQKAELTDTENRLVVAWDKDGGGNEMGEGVQ